ncbi:MAG TPA: sigma-70 family RNA polymerase sigma factor [Conexibacter sp.]|nr:sigma-70 family RNA polymerase sigma factor [Conexibacter sp.]
MQSRTRREESAADATLRLVQQHAAELLRFARRFSHCADDAHDAYQRAIEVLVRRVRDGDPPAQPLAWTRTVLRNEALAVRAQREQLVGRAAVDYERVEDRLFDDPADRVLGHERLRHTAEALRRLKPQELTALVLRAEGLSYREICTRTGWSYTRTNRTVTEGRRALRERLDAIESGAECDRWLPLLSALADGEATAVALAELRPHLRSCPGCRATLRDFHAMPSRVAALVPPALVGLAATTSHHSLTDHATLALHALAERASMLVVRAQGMLEGAPAAKLAAVAASTAALAGGGVALQQAAHAPAAPLHGARVAAATGHVSLAPIAFPSVRRPARPEARSEFGAARSGPSEFAPHASPIAEFAQASPPPAGTAPRASAAAAAPPPHPSRAPHGGASSEFAGP